jgi:tetratricopeptide (TPR) repeat protein
LGQLHDTAELEAKFKSGLALHQEGRLADAERAYQDVLRQQPNHFDAWYLLGIVALRTQRIKTAVECFGKAIALRPDHAESYNNRGAALASMGFFEAALPDYDMAIALKPDHAGAHNNRGAALATMNRPADALASYDCALALRPDSAELYTNRAAALAALRRPDAALASCDRAIALRSDYAPAHYNRGNALRDLGRSRDAVSAYDQAIVLRPDFAEAFNNRGAALAGLGRLTEALASNDQAIALRPTSPEAHNNRGAALADLGCFEDALASYDRAIALKPNYAEAYKNRGATLAGLGLLDDALSSCDRAIALQPDYAEAYANRAAALTNLGRTEAALADSDHAIALRQDLVEARYNKGICHLAMGDFERGWEGYQWRWKSRFVPQGRALPGQPWLGDSPIAGKTILVLAEQGFGDTIQFCRYVPMLAASATVVLDVPRPLLRLLSGLDGVARIIANDEPPPRFDAWVPVMSLPLAFRTTIETIPATIPYLHADVERSADWKHRLAALPGLKVGLVWAGSPFAGQPGARAMDRRRSISLAHYGALAAIPGISLISLQKGECADQARTPPDGMVLRDWTGELNDYADTAALVAALDLVISVDTSVVHLAGALGKPVWVLNRYDQCWRWLRDRTDSPWYPTARLFRQRTPGDWSGVIRDVADALRADLADDSDPG